MNSFMGNRQIIRAMLDNRKAEVLASPFQRWLLDRYGHILLRLCGWPVNVAARKRARIIFKHLADVEGKILDIGCSYGTHCFELSKKPGREITGIDIDHDNLQLGEEIREAVHSHNVRFLNRDISDNQFSDDEFDAVLMSQVIEHIPDDNAAVREVHRILRTGGVFVVSTDYSEAQGDSAAPHLMSDNRSDKDIPADMFVGGYHYREGYSKERIVSLMESNGFRVIDVSYVRLPKLLPRRDMLFPFTYPVSFLNLAAPCNKVDIVVKGEKTEIVAREQRN